MFGITKYSVELHNSTKITEAFVVDMALTPPRGSSERIMRVNEGIINKQDHL